MTAPAILRDPRLASARLVSTSLQRARGTWVRLCPRWYMTGSPAAWTTSEPKLRAAAARPGVGSPS